MQPSHTSLGARDGGGDRLLDFVTQRRRQLSHGHYPAHIGHVRLELPQPLALLLGPLAIFDVRQSSIPFADLAVLIAQRHSSNQNQRYSPSAFRWRASFSKGSPLTSDCCHLVTCSST